MLIQPVVVVFSGRLFTARFFTATSQYVYLIL